LIDKGAVRLNGAVAKLGDKAEADDEIFIEGNRIERSKKKHYYILNKPKGVLVTKKDPRGRKTIYGLDSVRALSKKLGQKLNYVGRLDGMSEGLLILTNDGELTNVLTHPSKHAKKTYKLRTEPVLSRKDVIRIEKGVYIEGRPLVGKVSKIKNNTFCLTIGEGRNRIIRRVMEKLGHGVYMLRRVGVENLELGDLGIGQIKELSAGEISELYSRVQ